MSIISRHEPNTKWWGSEVGIVQDPQFFSHSDDERAELLSKYSWVEFKSPHDQVKALDVYRSGFTLIDTQIGFRIELTNYEPPGNFGQIEVKFADISPFEIPFGVAREFKNERFLILPGLTQEKLDRRYVSWANQLIAQNPGFCMEVVCAGKIQGWYFSKPTSQGHELTLAMLHRDAIISGRILYSLAFSELKRKGAEIGISSFSAQNIAVLNILSGLGARFLSATGCWIWINPKTLR